MAKRIDFTPCLNVFSYANGKAKDGNNAKSTAVADKK